jgi:hypothetical protein
MRPLSAGVSARAGVDLRLDLLRCFGSDEVILELVADMKLEFAALRIGVGRARSIRWEVGMELLGGKLACPPKTLS